MHALQKRLALCPPEKWKKIFFKSNEKCYKALASRVELSWEKK